VSAYRIGVLRRKRDDGTAYWSFAIKWADERGAHRVSLGTTDRAAAEAKARKFWAERTIGHADTTNLTARPRHAEIRWVCGSENPGWMAVFRVCPVHSVQALKRNTGIFLRRLRAPASVPKADLALDFITVFLRTHRVVHRRISMGYGGSADNGVGL